MNMQGYSMTSQSNPHPHSLHLCYSSKVKISMIGYNFERPNIMIDLWVNVLFHSCDTLSPILALLFNRAMCEGFLVLGQEIALILKSGDSILLGKTRMI